MKKILMLIALIAVIGAGTASAQKTFHFVSDETWDGGRGGNGGDPSYFNYGYQDSSFVASIPAYPTGIESGSGVSVYVYGLTGDPYGYFNLDFLTNDEFETSYASVSAGDLDMDGYDYVYVQYLTENSYERIWHNVIYAYY